MRGLRAICTKGENRRKLSHTISALVPGPAALTAADARAREGTDAVLVFAVSLSRPASGPVMVLTVVRSWFVRRLLSFPPIGRGLE